MKLLTRYSRINVMATIIIFLIVSAAYYFSLSYVLMHQIDEDLKIEESEIRNYAAKYDRLPENFSFKDQLTSYRPATEPLKRHFENVLIRDKEEGNPEKYRQLVFTIKAGGRITNVYVSKSLEDTDALIRSILLITVLTILAIMVVSFLINRVVLKRIWRPFYASLQQVNSFRIGNTALPELPKTNIDEFNFMNENLQAIIQRAQHDYLSLKTFSDNASHEIQTPIAIIRSKLDLLIQDEALSEKQGSLLQAAYNAIERLSRLNQSLLLLARIENRQFEPLDKVALDEKLNGKIADFQELWQDRSIHPTVIISPVTVLMNKELADLLLNNLLSNGTRHNLQGGKLLIELQPGYLKISNSGSGKPLDVQRIFQRFYKGEEGSVYNGLGLSIIKQICDVSGFKISYDFKNGLHQFTIILS